MSDLPAGRLDAVTVRLDVVGGLEIRKVRGWWICLAGQDEPLDRAFILDLKRRAVAVRGLLVAAVPDWSALPQDTSGAPLLSDVGEQALAELRRVRAMVKTVTSRRLYGLCLRCGYADSWCRCGNSLDPGDLPTYTAKELAWAT